MVQRGGGGTGRDRDGGRRHDGSSHRSTGGHRY
jgi:hypothetical protein